MNKRFKYPRTYHLPWSLGRSSDDKVIKTLDDFIDLEVVVTEKMDGENTTLYSDYFHARSIDSSHHPSRDWIKAFHSSFKHEIPDGIRICGENLYAKHSIYYSDLLSYFYGFSVWEFDVCLNWNDTLEYFQLLNIIPVPILYQGKFDINFIKNIDVSDKEGYVVRNVDSFHYNNFGKNVAKFVRANHVQTDSHWMTNKIIPNKIIPN